MKGTVMADPATRDIDVLCAGLAVADVMAKAVDELPAWDHLGTFDHIEHHIGGCAVNTAVDLVKLGSRVAVSACIANDAAGQFIRRRLETQGLEVSALVETDKASSSYTFVMIGSDGRRRYLHHVGANAHFADTDVPDDMLVRARILHVGGTFLMPALDGEPTARLLKRAKRFGVTTSMDTAFNVNVDCAALIDPCLPHLDIFIPSIEEAQAITGRQEPDTILEWFADKPVPILGVKLGNEGCVLRADGTVQRYPAFRVNVVDGSGAGDAFMAGFLYGVLHGWDLGKAARFANATAAHCIQAIGCSTGIPPAEQVRRFMSTWAP